MLTLMKNAATSPTKRGRPAPAAARRRPRRRHCVVAPAASGITNRRKTTTGRDDNGTTRARRRHVGGGTPASGRHGVGTGAVPERSLRWKHHRCVRKRGGQGKDESMRVSTGGHLSI